VGLMDESAKDRHRKTRVHLKPYPLHPTPYTLHPTPYTLHPTPYTLRATVRPVWYYLVLGGVDLEFKVGLMDESATDRHRKTRVHPTPSTLRPTPYTLHPTPHTLHHI